MVISYAHKDVFKCSLTCQSHANLSCQHLLCNIRGTEIDVIGVIFVTETDMVGHHIMVAAVVDHGAIMMMDPLHQDSLADHLAQAGSHHIMASQAISHHPMPEIEGADAPLGVTMVHQV